MQTENDCELDNLRACIAAKRALLPNLMPTLIDVERSAIKLPSPQKKKTSIREHDPRNGYWSSLVRSRGLRYEACRLDSYRVSNDQQREVIDRLKAFSESLVDNTRSGKGIMLFGPKGTGKDHLLMAMAHQAVARGIKVDWVNGADMRGDVRDSTRNDELERDYASRLINHKVLWISDPLPISGCLTEAQQDRLFRVIDGRYSNLKPTWVTVNVSSRDELEERMGPQNADRLRDDALALFCDWPSHRATLIQAEASTIGGLLRDPIVHRISSSRPKSRLFIEPTRREQQCTH